MLEAFFMAIHDLSRTMFYCNIILKYALKILHISMCTSLDNIKRREQERFEMLKFLLFPFSSYYARTLCKL